jgi:hypothetical protein
MFLNNYLCSLGPLAANSKVSNGRVSDKPRSLPRHQRAQAQNSTHTVSTSVLCTGYVETKLSPMCL